MRAEHAIEGEAVSFADHDVRMFNSAVRLIVSHPETGSAPLSMVAETLRLRRLSREDVAAQVAQARAKLPTFAKF